MLGLEFWGPLLFALLIAGVGIWSYQGALTAWQTLLQPMRDEVADLKKLRYEQDERIDRLSGEVEALQIANRRLRLEVETLEHRMMAYYRQLVDAHMTPDPNYKGDATLSPGEAAYSSVAAQIESELAAQAATAQELAALRQQLIDAGIEPDAQYGAKGEGREAE